MSKDFQIQMTFTIIFDKEGYEFRVNLNEPEHIAEKGEKASKAYLASIGKEEWEKQINRIRKICDRKHQSYLALENSLKTNEVFLRNKQNRGFALLLNNTDDNEKIGVSIENFYKHILEKCSVTFH